MKVTRANALDINPGTRQKLAVQQDRYYVQLKPTLVQFAHESSSDIGAAGAGGNHKSQKPRRNAAKLSSVELAERSVSIEKSGKSIEDSFIMINTL